MTTEWGVAVSDTARLHVAALIDADIKDERVFAFSEPYNWNSIFELLRKIKPDHKWPENIKDNSQDKSKVLPRGRADEILKKNFGAGFLSLEEALRNNLVGL